MSLFHDDPFNTSDVEGEPDVVEDTSDTGMGALQVVEECVEASRPSRKRSRESTPSKETHETLETAPLGAEAGTAGCQLDEDAAAAAAAGVVEGEAPKEEGAPATNQRNVDGEEAAYGSLNVTLCQQLAAHREEERQASTVSLQATVLEQQHLIHQLQADKVTMQDAWDAERAHTEHTLARHRAATELSVASATDAPEGAHEAALARQRTAEGESQLSLGMAEREARLRHVAEAEADGLRAAMAWQARATLVYKTAYEAALKKQFPSYQDTRPLMETAPSSALQPVTSQLQPADATCASICDSLDKAREWLLSRIAASHATSAADGNEAPSTSVGAAFPLHAVQQLAQLLSMLGGHVRAISAQHDVAVRDAAMQARALQALTDGCRQAGLYDLEPRIALLRETIDRQVSASIPTTQETLSLRQCHQLQSRVALLEAIVSRHILKADRVPEPSSVVPHVLKERIGRCDALEKEVAALRSEVAYLQRVVAQEGAPVAELSYSTPQSSVGGSEREMLLENCGKRWLCRASSATSLLVAQSSDAAMWTKGNPLLQAELVHATQHCEAQHAAIVSLQECNEVLRQQMHACTAMAEVLCQALRAYGEGTDVEALDDTDSQGEGAVMRMPAAYQRVVDTIRERCAGACVWTEAREDHTVAQFNGVCEHLDKTLANNVSEMQGIMHDKELRHLQVIRCLSNALQTADGALCDVLGLEARPVSASLVAVAQALPIGSTGATRTAAPLTRTVDVRDAVAKVSAAHHEALQKLERTFRTEIQAQRERWDWLLSQDGNAALQALAQSRDECTSLRAANASAEERAAAAKRLAEEVGQLKKRLAEREARVASLEAQLKVSQETLSKSRQEVLTITRDNGARVLLLEQELSGAREQVSSLELQLAAATAPVEDAYDASGAGGSGDADNEPEFTEGQGTNESIQANVPHTESMCADWNDNEDTTFPNDAADETMADGTANEEEPAYAVNTAAVALGDTAHDEAEDETAAENDASAQEEGPEQEEVPEQDENEASMDNAVTLFGTGLADGAADANE